jgi:hypothetical protein
MISNTAIFIANIVILMISKYVLHVDNCLEVNITMTT